MRGRLGLGLALERRKLDDEINYPLQAQYSRVLRYRRRLTKVIFSPHALP